MTEPATAESAPFHYSAANKPPSCRDRAALFFSKRSALFWAITITTALIAMLFVASQIAHDRGQNVEWYSGFGQWLGALGSLTAAAAALWIATRDRSERVREREAADEAQARLVLVRPGRNGISADFGVLIQNCGSRPILEVAVEEAGWPSLNDDSRMAGLRMADERITGNFADVVLPGAPGALTVNFVDSEGNSFPKELEKDVHGNPVFETTPDGLEVKVSFMDANGNRWEIGPFTDAVRQRYGRPRRIDK
jgi:hypothetical protein